MFNCRGFFVIPSTVGTRTPFMFWLLLSCLFQSTGYCFTLKTFSLLYLNISCNAFACIIQPYNLLWILWWTASTKHGNGIGNHSEIQTNKSKNHPFPSNPMKITFMLPFFSQTTPYSDALTSISLQGLFILKVWGPCSENGWINYQSAGNTSVLNICAMLVN